MRIVTKIEKLRSASEEVNPGEIGRLNVQLVDPMKKILKKVGGLGLAAIQIGYARQLFIMTNNEGEVFPVYNPKIVDQYDKVRVDREACLSIPKKTFNTMRCKYVEVEWIDEHKKSRKTLFQGSEAVVFQHECDHLMGVLVSDRQLKPTTRKGPKIGRNSLCYCGSGKKYKKCCLNKDEAHQYDI